tara:strand:- start:300 stop:950 length:651 start_codon:yes stop_codon:yes gene_type:complete
MFETRPHSIVKGSSLNKRKIQECLIEFANKLSRLEDDSLGRYTIGRDRIGLTSVMNPYKAEMIGGFQALKGKSTAGNAIAYLGAARIKLENNSSNGYYWLNWSIGGTIKSDVGWVGAFPFIGTESLTGLGDHLERPACIAGWYLSENYSEADPAPVPQVAFNIQAGWNTGLKFSLGGSGSFYLSSASTVVGIMAYVNNGGEAIVEHGNMNIIERIR